VADQVPLLTTSSVPRRRATPLTTSRILAAPKTPTSVLKSRPIDGPELGDVYDAPRACHKPMPSRMQEQSVAPACDAGRSA